MEEEILNYEEFKDYYGEDILKLNYEEYLKTIKELKGGIK